MPFKIRFKALKAYKENVKTLKQEVLKDDVKSFEHVTSNMSKENVITHGDIENTGIENVSQDNNVLTSVKRPVKTSKDNIVSLNKRVLNIESDVKTNNVISYLTKMYKDGDIVDVKTLKSSFEMSAREWQRLRNEIPELVTKGTNTYFVNNTVWLRVILTYS